MDEETGWVYFGRRYYDASWGRWTTADPVWFADGPNLYAYVHHNPLRYLDPDGLSAVENKDEGGWFSQTTLGGGFSRGFIDDTSWGASDFALGEYHSQNWWAYGGYGLGTACSMAVGLATGNTELKLASKILGAGGKMVGRVGRAFHFTAKELKAASKVESTAGKIVKEVAPKIEKNLHEVGKGGNLSKIGGSPKSIPDNHMWTSGSPFKNKTAEELHQMFVNKGYRGMGSDPISGKGSYINPQNGRKYHVDPQHIGRYREPSHVDVSRPEKYNGSLPKKRFIYLDD